MKRVITTVGTSLFSNSEKNVMNLDNIDYNETLFENENVDKVAKKIRELEKVVLEWIKTRDNNTSAEISSLIQIHEQIKEPVEAHLICSYTILSRIAAEVIQKFFEEHYDKDKKKFVKFEIYIVENLLVTKKDIFKKGIKELFRVFGDDVVKKDCKGKRIWSEIIFNITGGYKSVVPYLNILAQLYRLDSYYVFNEDTNTTGYELIKLPSLPVNFDLSIFEDNYLAFELISEKPNKVNFPTKHDFLEYVSDEEFKQFQDIFLIKEENGKIRLAELGLLLYQAFEDSEKDFGFGRSNMFGKFMEIQVFKYFKGLKANLVRVELGEQIGKSIQNDSYDLDVYYENEKSIYAIEVKPHGISILKTGNEKRDGETIEHKCEIGAFKCSFEEYKSKHLKNILLMYHHREPAKHQIENFRKLKFTIKPSCADVLEFVWLSTSKSYRTDVNWSITKNMLKRYDFDQNKWVDFQ